MALAKPLPEAKYLGFSGSYTAYLEYPYKGADPQITQNSLLDRESFMADCTRRTTRFEKDELIFSKEKTGELISNFKTEEEYDLNKTIGKNRIETSFPDYTTSSRMQRAVTFVLIARAQEFLPYRIAMFISALECLLSTL